MKREQVLATAEELINGQRAEDYGDAYDNFLRIAEGWNIIIREAMTTHGYVTPQHVALMMDWLKTARLLNGTDHDDSWIDKCGYSALGAEFTQRDKEVSDRISVFMGGSDDR